MNANNDAEENESVVVNFLICLMLFLYGCGPNLLISTVAVLVRLVIQFRAKRAMKKAAAEAKLIEEHQEIDMLQRKLADFNKTTVDISISIIPIVGPIVAFYRHK